MLYLASQSPQRSSLLSQAHVPFALVESACVEEEIHLPHPQATAIERAIGKARGVDLSQCELAAHSVILAADTVVILNNTLIGKPKDREDAKTILQSLQGTTHTVATGHCCLRPANGEHEAREAAGLALTKVTMRPMTAEEINAYVESGESDNRAGAYAIQETGDKYVVDMDGDFDNVVGLHLPTVERLFRQCTDADLPRDGAS